MVKINPTMANLKRACQKFGAELSVVEAGKWVNVDADAPEGKVWEANGLVTLHTEWMVGDAKYRAESITDMLDRMSYGVSDDVDPEELP